MTAHGNTIHRPRPVRDDDLFVVSIHEGELQRIANWVAEYPRRETGGDLFGFWTHTGAPAVQLTLGPGPNARHEHAAFFQDADYLRNRGRRAQDQYGLQHIGDWHSHHELGLAEPSSGDVSTALRTLELNGFTRFLIFVANIRAGERAMIRRRFTGQVQINAFLFERGRPSFRRGRFQVLPGESPTGASAERAGIIKPVGGELAPVAVPVVAAPAAGPRPQGWFTEQWGTEFLRRVDATCRELFRDCRMMVTPDGALTYHFSNAAGNWSMAFPPDFPDGEVHVLLEERPAARIAPHASMTDADFCRTVTDVVTATTAPRPAPRVEEPTEAAAAEPERSDVE
ncbi:Mov34/MPN/PAD-1 family protein [Actinoplanes subtropicus]|uniref:Mov34/MPN/PAD-1 family protein n=1 Tax=Actinoplanes subtropicus TaxID=543632 RepID=UPI0004C2F269|nr:Mov34/MPN/PAD-1 family protein [Actinoplanes subtropicus]